MLRAKETTMKLIRIFALTMFTAVIAAAQGTPAQSGSANKPGSSQPPSATPAASPAKSPAVTASSKAAAKPGSATAKKTATKPAAKPAATTTAKPANGKSPAAQPAAPKTSAPVTAKKPVVATGSLPEKTKPAARSTAPAGKPKAVVANGAKPVVAPAKPATAPKKVVVAKPAVKTPEPKPSIARVEPPPKQEKKPVPAKLLGAAGRRDPFISPIRNVSSLQPGQSCNSGKRCLAIPELILQGTVRDITGKMMAVVSTSNRRTYTLRENDQVFNGSVEKITTDSIIFREYVKDPLGREAAREVVKKLGPTS
jgi:hypothetical protein